MTNSTVLNKKPEHIWQASVLRLSAFFPPKDSIDPSSWWKSIVGELPENQNFQPRVGILREEGSYEGGRLVHTVQPDRADWIYIPAFDQQTGSPAFDHLQDYEPALEKFRKVVDGFLTISPNLSRIAFGVVLNFLVDDGPSGYRLLANYLPSVNIDPENSSDFHYQINRRRLSKTVNGLLINRLSKWSVNITKFSQLALGPAVQEFIISKSDNVFANVELDVNTVPEQKSLISREQLNSLFSELVDLASEIANQGDIP